MTAARRLDSLAAMTHVVGAWLLSAGFVAMVLIVGVVARRIRRRHGERRLTKGFRRARGVRRSGSGIQAYGLRSDLMNR
ncbi:MAG: hypothetical protein ACREER_14150 [Alphaproteobacteria bacterium]